MDPPLISVEESNHAHAVAASDRLEEEWTKNFAASRRRLLGLKRRLEDQHQQLIIGWNRRDHISRSLELVAGKTLEVSWL